MPYNQKILNHANNPRNLGSLDKYSNDVGTGFVGNAACGDMLQVQLMVKNNKIIDVKAKTYGCGCAIAATSLATEKLLGRTLEEAKQLTNQELADELELPKIKIHCSVLAREAVSKAIDNYLSKQNEIDNTDQMQTYEFEISKQKLQAENYDKHKKADDTRCETITDNNEIHQMSCCSKQNHTAISDTQAQEESSCCKTKNQQSVPAEQNQNLFTKDNKAPIQLTKAAYNRFIEILSQHQEAKGILILSEDGGCAGNTYDIQLAQDNIDSTTKEYIFDDLKIYVPAASLMYIFGTTIDYEITDEQAGFKFSNATRKVCGCGSSFR